MAEVRVNYLGDVTALARASRQAQGELTKVGNAADRQSKGMGKSFKVMGAVAAGGLATLAVGAAGVVKSAVTLEAEFSKTMNTMAAVADVPAAGIEKLSALAMKMGADTVFSANDAGEAMLELAKGGLTAAQIEAGALKATLTLAAAGGLDMATAATFASNAMNAFGLKAEDATAVAAALAGGANASSASVESLGQALSQVGPGAVNAGLSLQETVAALAAFDNAGIKGSDAGTSLKTMLASLVPKTSKARKEMKALGLDFTNANGSFKPLSDIAGQLQAKLGKLSQEQRSLALSTIFGSDASRAAAVLAKEGAAGIEALTKKTSDLTAAQRVADASTKGTAGAIEAMKGSLETAGLAIGRAIAPLVTLIARGLTIALNAVTPLVMRLSAQFRSGEGTGGKMRASMDRVRQAFERNRPEIMKIIAALKTFAIFVATKVVPVLVDLYSKYLSKVIDVAAGVVRAIESIKNGVRDAIDAIKDFGRAVKDIPGAGVVGKVGDVVGDITSGRNPFSNPFNVRRSPGTAGGGSLRSARPLYAVLQIDGRTVATTQFRAARFGQA